MHIRKMQSQITRYHYTPSRMTFKLTMILCVSRDVKQLEHFFRYKKWSNHFGKITWQFLINFSYNASDPLLGTYIRETNHVSSERPIYSHGSFIHKV